MRAGFIGDERRERRTCVLGLRQILCNRCLRFATTVANVQATLVTKRALPLTWAGPRRLVRPSLRLAHFIRYLVGVGEQPCKIETAMAARSAVFEC
jgi:hypothetical protein